MGTQEHRGEDEAAYARRLKRYEAEDTVVARTEDDGGSPIEFYSPFGPMIAKLRMPDALVDKLNRYADGVIDQHDQANQATAIEKPLGEFGLAQKFVFEGGGQSLASMTENWIRQYLATANDRDPERVRFEMFWMVRHFAGTFSPVHFHSGDISGIVYLKIPDSISNEAAEETKNYISARRAGYITFLIGGKQQYSKSLISFKPEVGDFYIVPGWLLHAVEPFEGEGERRSMSFNAFVD